MKIQYRILIGFLIVMSIGFVFLIRWTMNDVKKQAAKTLEESLIDISQILATSVELNTQSDSPNVKFSEKLMELSLNKKFSAKVYKLLKTEVGIRVYVTDKLGKVIYDSKGKNLGDDFSKKNDVYLTLRGKYGARTTRTNKNDPMSSHYFVAAPIKHSGIIVGVLTVSKPARNLNVFIENARKKILIYGLIAFFITIILSYLITLWIVIPMKKLVKYTNNIYLPIDVDKLGGGEVKELGKSIVEMKEKLEGKEYVENYIQTLTHEIKSPLSTIIGASEILKNNLSEKERNKFVENIESESKRIEKLIEKMLGIASLERKTSLKEKVKVDLIKLIENIVEKLDTKLKLNELKVVFEKTESEVEIFCDSSLMEMVFENIISNSIDFSGTNSEINILIKKTEKNVVIEISDEGTGIPEYAIDKVFDKFYSLKRPKTGKKSTGLGLAIVKEIINLHNGNISLKNNFKGGLTVKIELKTI